MKNISKGAPVSLEASELRSTAAARRERDPVPRRIYVTMRLAEIGASIIEMAKERENLSSDLKAAPGADGPSHKQLRQRRAYVAERIDMLRKEQSDLNSEKRAMAPVSGPGGGGEKTNDGPNGVRKAFN